MSNINVIVLEGGYNEEHEVSLLTAKEVKKAILELGYNLGLFESFNFKELEKKLIYFFGDSSMLDYYETFLGYNDKTDRAFSSFNNSSFFSDSFGSTHSKS